MKYTKEEIQEILKITHADILRQRALKIGGAEHATCLHAVREVIDVCNELLAVREVLLEACKNVLLAIDAFPHSKQKSPLGKPNGGIAKMLRAAIIKAMGAGALPQPSTCETTPCDEDCESDGGCPAEDD